MNLNSLIFIKEKKFQISNIFFMSKKISIAIDAMGGDNAPDKTINGVKLFLEKN